MYNLYYRISTKTQYDAFIYCACKESDESYYFGRTWVFTNFKEFLNEFEIHA